MQDLASWGEDIFSALERFLDTSADAGIKVTERRENKSTMIMSFCERVCQG